MKLNPGLVWGAELLFLCAQVFFNQKNIELAQTINIGKDLNPSCLHINGTTKEEERALFCAWAAAGIQGMLCTVITVINRLRLPALAATLVTAILLTRQFHKVKPVAGYLLWPYVAFLTFANALNWCASSRTSLSAAEACRECQLALKHLEDARMASQKLLSSRPRRWCRRGTSVVACSCAGTSHCIHRERTHPCGGVLVANTLWPTTSLHVPRFHLQENSDRPIEQSLRETADLKNPGEAGYTPAGSDPKVRADSRMGSNDPFRRRVSRWNKNG